MPLLPPSWGTLYELTKLDDDTFDQKLHDGTINPEMQRKDVARATGKQVSASDGTGKARSKPSRRKKANLAPRLDPRAWSMSTPQEREAFVKTVGRSAIENALNAIESGCKLTRGLNSLNQSWKAATEPERRTFCRQYYEEMNRLGWQQKW